MATSGMEAEEMAPCHQGGSGHGQNQWGEVQKAKEVAGGSVYWLGAGER